MPLLDPAHRPTLHGGGTTAVEPATGEPLASFTLAAPADVESAAAEAAAAQAPGRVPRTRSAPRCCAGPGT